MSFLVAAARRLAYRIWRARVEASLTRADACRVFDLDLVIAPGVLHPGHFASSRLLASHLGRLPLRGLQVADVGTGSGILALIAARAGASVSSLDISPVAVECAAANASRNGLAHLVTTAESDVWDALPPDRTFDLVLTNPPFYPRDARAPSDQPFAAGSGHRFFVRLAEGLPARLRHGGSLLLIHSSDTDFTPIAAILRAQGLVGKVTLEKRSAFETLTVRQFSTAAALS
jgi:release factor glutamine methyltransferase